MESTTAGKPAAGAGAGAASQRDRRAARRAMAPQLGVPTKLLAFSKLAASSSAMSEVFKVLHRVASTDVTVTFLGETGTGKDVFARAVHEASPRADGPFVV